MATSKGCKHDSKDKIGCVSQSSTSCQIYFGLVDRNEWNNKEKVTYLGQLHDQVHGNCQRSKWLSSAHSDHD
jgi:hypothetical protein